MDANAMRQFIEAALSDSAAALARLMREAAALDAIAEAARVLTETFRRGGRVFSCGNGGSMADAIHFAEELSGRFRGERPPLAAVAISDPGHLTCTANDYGYDEVFSRYLEAHGRAGDAVLCLSTSGESRNVVRAAERARSMQLAVVALTGHADAALGRAASIHICTPSGRHSDRVQELHIKVIHILIELIERQLYPQNYADPGT